ncbi:hypothetical protein KTAU_21010 [Thermogemmatispora aurantia]|uniref:Uncharacterized protein n=1 Tax=Thermogemmatispora aurantia TaxID=2045279 RepID=A0A5J4K475_9CHLR|nr:hypothetical protein KTAU_21010 [Thermogemmatispora aurantia]
MTSALQRVSPAAGSFCSFVRRAAIAALSTPLTVADVLTWTSKIDLIDQENQFWGKYMARGGLLSRGEGRGDQKGALFHRRLEPEQAEKRAANSELVTCYQESAEQAS